MGDGERPLSSRQLVDPMLDDRTCVDPDPHPYTGEFVSTTPALLLLAMTIASGAAMRGAFAPVQEMAKLDLGLSDLQISLVQGLAASIPIAVLAIPIGRLVDRSNRTRLLAAMAVVWTLGTLLTVTAPGFTMLFLARMLAGLGAISALPVAISIAADLSPPEKRGRSLLLLSLGQSVGLAVAFALGGWLSGLLAAPDHGWLARVGIAPWRGVHLVFGAGSALMLLLLLALREPARSELGEAADAALGPVLRELWERRRFLAPLFVGQVSVVMADTAAGIWAAPVLIRDHGLRPDQFAGWMGLVILLPGALGSVIGGVAADLGHKLHLRGGILAGAVVASAVAIPAAFFPLMSGALGFGLMLSLLLLCGAITGLVTATAIAVLIPNELRGVCLGAFIVLGAIIGFGVAPTLVTLASARLGGEAFLASALTMTGVAISGVSLLAFALAMAGAPQAPSST